MIYVAIDPGEKGAAAFLSKKGLSVYPFPEKRKELYEILEKLSQLAPYEYVVGMEAVHALSGVSAASTFTFGMGVGWWLGIFEYLGIKHASIDITRWQEYATVKPDKVPLRGLDKTAQKAIKKDHKKALKMESLRAATLAFPKVRLPSHDCADAVNMVRYLQYVHRKNGDRI